MDFAVVDFETKAIAPRPKYPPRPVGVGIHAPWQRPKYFAFDHPTRNNCKEDEARAELARVYESGIPIVFHNAKFDTDVAEEHWQLPMPEWQRIHCTQILAFLYHPDAFRIGLKELGEDLLKIEPVERDEVREWIFANVPGAKQKKKNWGGHICDAPGNLVGKYVKLDLRLPRELFNFLHPYVMNHGMSTAYDRERQLIPLLLDMERRGVAIEYERLEEDCGHWAHAGEIIDDWIRWRLNSPELDINSPHQLVDALMENEFTRNPELESIEWPATKKGQLSTAMKVIPQVVTDQEFLEVFTMRSRYKTALQTFGRPWCNMASETGRIFTIWNQTKRDDESNRRNAGARTGRLSSQPNFQNIPKKPEIFTDTFEEKTRLWDDSEIAALVMPENLARIMKDEGVPLVLPDMRGYIRADDDHTLIIRDYSQQELRILAHFEDGALMEQYRANPFLDVHSFARELIIEKTGKVYKRGPVKTVGFGILYGQGLDLLSDNMRLPKATAKALRAAYKDALPGIKDLEGGLRQLAKDDEPLHTWGGREYYCEPPGYSEKHQRWMTFEYKMLNTLIQGSAADCTKEAMLRYDVAREEGMPLVQVHDEIVGQAPTELLDREMTLLRESMESVEFDVAMLSDGKTGQTWSSATKYEDKRAA